MQRAVRNGRFEQPRRLQKVNEERQLSKRRQSRLSVPFHPNRTGETVDADARRHLRVLNRWLSTHRVRRRGRERASYPSKCTILSTSKTPTAVSRVKDARRRLNPLGGEPVEMWTTHPRCPQSDRRNKSRSSGQMMCYYPA